MTRVDDVVDHALRGAEAHRQRLQSMAGNLQGFQLALKQIVVPHLAEIGAVQQAVAQRAADLMITHQKTLAHAAGLATQYQKTFAHAADLMITHQKTLAHAAELATQYQKTLRTALVGVGPALDAAAKVAAVVAPLAAKVTADFARMQELLKYMSFYIAMRALHDGDIEAVDYFLVHYCAMRRPTLEAHGALWEVLHAGGWRQADNPVSYVKTAFWRQYKREGARNKLLLEDGRIVPLESVAGALWTPQDGNVAADEQLFIKQILDCMTPQDRRALLAYYFGYAGTLREGYGSKNAADAGRRRINKLAEKLRPYLLS